MKITEEKPSERVFNIQLNEAELRLIGVIIANASYFKVGEWCETTSEIKGAVYKECEDIDSLYRTIVNALNGKTN